MPTVLRSMGGVSGHPVDKAKLNIQLPLPHKMLQKMRGAIHTKNFCVMVRSLDNAGIVPSTELAKALVETEPCPVCLQHARRACQCMDPAWLMGTRKQAQGSCLCFCLIVHSSQAPYKRGLRICQHVGRRCLRLRDGQVGQRLQEPALIVPCRPARLRSSV